MALRSFLTRSRDHSWGAEYLPALSSALYDGLIDDDDEVRDAAAGAASRAIGAYAVAPTAADGLVLWLAGRFGETDEFRWRVICRMVGQQQQQAYSPGEVRLTPAESQLREALQFDDSLFVTEEQNLFVDEVRDTTRWRRAFERMRWNTAGEEPSFRCLREWVMGGLRCLIGLAQREEEGEDGPLGWTSDQHVFAVCARVLLCAVAIARVSEDDVEVVELLREFDTVGGKARVHGSLLEMSKLEAVS